MKTLATLAAIGSLCGTIRIRADEVLKPEPLKTKDYSVVAIEGRFAAYVGLAPIILDSKIRDKTPLSYLEAIERFGPAFAQRLSATGTWEWHFDDRMIYRVQSNWSGPLSAPVALKLENTNRQIIQGGQTKAEQAGAGQHAIRPESKSKESQKPQPESEGRSR